MWSWTLTDELENNSSLHWDDLVRAELGPDIHESRIRGFCLSREALKKTLVSLGKEIGISDLRLLNYSELQMLPNYTLSLSHSKDIGAAIVATKNEYLSVGIDIESVERIVKEPILERITHRGDIKRAPIEIWTIKEAAFKTLMNSKKVLSPVEFSSIQILEDSWLHSPSGLKGHWEIERVKKWVVARGFLKT